VGTGKTHLAIALAATACQQDIPAKYFTTASLVMHLRRAKDNDRLDKELALIGRNKLLVIDDFGYLPSIPKAHYCCAKSSPMATNNASWWSPPTQNSTAGSRYLATTPWPQRHRPHRPPRALAGKQSYVRYDRVGGFYLFSVNRFRKHSGDGSSPQLLR
jgi:hypothetical protein